MKRKPDSIKRIKGRRLPKSAVQVMIYAIKQDAPYTDEWLSDSPDYVHAGGAKILLTKTK